MFSLAGRCPPLPNITHATSGDVRATEGSFVTLTCDEGHWFNHSRSAVAVARCSNFRWNISAEYECVGKRLTNKNTNQSFCALNHVFDLSPAVDCGDPTADLQRASLSPLSSTDTTFQSVATVTCDLGYTFQGQRSRSVQCSASGDWMFLDDVRGNETSEVLTDCQRKFIPRLFEQIT